MAKVAKLVVTTFITRVVVDENVSLEEIAELVKPKLLDKINNNEVAENIETILPDEECPTEIINEIQQLLLNNDKLCISFDTPIKTGIGLITEIDFQGVYIEECGDSTADFIYLENIDGNDLANLYQEMELQLESDQKVFDRTQDY